MPKPRDFSLDWNAPKAGDYDAHVTNIEIFSGDRSRCGSVRYETVIPVYGLFEYVRIDAPTHHPRYAEIGPGKARIVQLAEAAGIDPKTITSIDALPDLLIGVGVKSGSACRSRTAFRSQSFEPVFGPAGPELPAAGEPPDNAK